MKLNVLTSLVCLCLAAAGITRPNPGTAGAELNPEEIARLARGELVVKPLGGSGHNSMVAGVSYVLVNASPQRVWAALEDIPSWPNIFPNTFETQTVAVSGNAKAVRMSLGNRLVTFNFFLTVSFNKDKWELAFQLNEKKPHDINKCKGFVRLIPQPGGRTLVVFSSITEFPFSGIVNLMGTKVIGWIEHRVLSVPARLKKWVEVR